MVMSNIAMSPSMTSLLRVLVLARLCSSDAFVAATARLLLMVLMLVVERRSIGNGNGNINFYIMD
jgi:phosphate starvation-inducible membrane PsiE